MKRKLLGLILFGLSVLPAPLYAAAGIGVSPGIKEITLAENESRTSFEVTVSNTTESPIDFRLSTIDFGALDESGGIAFLGRSGQEAYAYSLSEWMELDKTELTVTPNSSEAVKVTIQNNDALRPGGHYGAVLVTSRQDGQLSSESVATLPGASTLVLLKKTGGETYDLTLDNVKTNTSLLRVPNSAELRFENTGNVHVVPRGTIQLKSPFGKTIAQGTINEASSFVLPGSKRVISVPPRFSSQPWLPGRYTQEISWRHDGQESFETTITHHWYLGRIGVGILIILSLVIVLYLYIIYKKRPVTRN